MQTVTENWVQESRVPYKSLGSGDSSVVRAPNSWLKGRGFESLQEQREIFWSKVSFLCWLLFRYPFHPRVTAAACKRSRSFCQKYRWKVTAKHACTLGMWLCIKLHGAWLYGVHRTRRDGNSAVSTPLWWIFKKLVTHVESHASAVSLLESREL